MSLIDWYWLIALSISTLVLLGLVIASYLFYIWEDNQCPLVHLTTSVAAGEIKASQSYIAKKSFAIWALRKSIYDLCETEFELMLVTLLFPMEKLEIPVEVVNSTRHLFRLVRPIGPITSLKCLCGNYYAPFRHVPFAFKFKELQSTSSEIRLKLYYPDTYATLLALFIFFVKIYVSL